MRDHSNHIIKGRHQAVNDFIAQCAFESKTETVALKDAVNRVLAETQYALHSLPNKPTSNMDAIAVHFDDFADGMPDVKSWVCGVDYQFCNTGVAMPDGFDTAIAIENVELDDEHITALTYLPQERGEAVSPVGSALAKGCELVLKGTLLRPAHLALLAQGGHTEVLVVSKPKVTFIPTGSELVEVRANPPAGKNIDCNSFDVCAKLAEWGADVVRYAIVPDDRALLKAALDEATMQSDIVVINAGSSKGSDDWTCEILEEQGEMLSHETDVAPGRHASTALLNNTPVVGISGPPPAADLNVEMFVKPLIDIYLTNKKHPAPIIYANLEVDMPMRPRKAHICQRVKLYRDQAGYLWAQPVSNQAPVLKGVAEANGVLIIPKDSTGFHAGEQVPIELLWPYVVTF